MKSFVFASLITFALLPNFAWAHATPIETSPAPGEQLSSFPEVVQIRFSERLEEGSSVIKVTDESGRSRNQFTEVKDQYTLLAPLDNESNNDGIYLITWSVVSKDDGHFTRGSYAFSVGSSTAPSMTDSQIVQITTYSEISLIFVEFLGNSLLWGAFVVYAIILRRIPSLTTTEEVRLSKFYFWTVLLGSCLVVIGAFSQLALKSYELSQLHQSSLLETFKLYLATSAGTATLCRGLAMASLGLAFLFLKPKLLRSVAHHLLLLALLIFAYFRATISHATANPFYPEVSIAINFLHLIEKDAWLGVLLVLLSLYLLKAIIADIGILVSRVWRFLNFNLALLSVTASYIIWLHLKEFENLLSTNWGEALIPLLVASLLLLCLRTYQVLIAHWKPTLFIRFFSLSLSAEIVIATVVVCLSSVIIVTSPPLSDVRPIFQYAQDDTTIQLTASPSEDGQVLVVINKNIEPKVLIGSSDSLIEAPLTKRFAGGYVFPAFLINKTEGVTVIVPGHSTYDVRAHFEFKPDSFKNSSASNRSLDWFTIVFILIALAGLVYSITLHLLSNTIELAKETTKQKARGVLIGTFLSITVIALTMTVAKTFLPNYFKQLCVSDGNTWHVMQPTKDRLPTSATSREGCMLADGSYHFTDKREYQYLSGLSAAEVTLNTKHPTAGVPATLTLTLKESDGSPATLMIEHEKLLHIIVISADLKYFAHLHPDETRAYTKEELHKSEFIFKHTFPKTGKYLVAVDYRHGLKHESRQFMLSVEGGGESLSTPTLYDIKGTFQGYDVKLSYPLLLAGQLSTLQFNVSRDGQPVTDLVPYLGAAMHVAIVKNDLSEFVHTHGEVHSTSTVLIASSTNSHNHPRPPANFGPNIESHLIFPNPGMYTVFAEFKHNNQVVPSFFTIRVE